jgi:hypothetical protein
MAPRMQPRASAAPALATSANTSAIVLNFMMGSLR